MIPERLWAEATKLVRVHGLHPVSKAMRLSYDGLKKHLKSEVNDDGGDIGGFVELLPADAGVRVGEVAVELMDTKGRRMTIRGVGQQDIERLMMMFLEGVSR